MENKRQRMVRGPRDVEALVGALGRRSIVLVGLMGSGKTAIGRRVAQRLGMPFVDADEEIERAAGQSIPEIFETHGEAYFRSGEARVVARLLADKPGVIATGGGAFMDDNTRSRIKEQAISIWLKADLRTLMHRVAKRNNRPLLRNSDPEGVMRRLMAERYPIYGLSDITVESREDIHDVIVLDVIEALNAWVNPGRLES